MLKKEIAWNDLSEKLSNYLITTEEQDTVIFNIVTQETIYLDVDNVALVVAYVITENYGYHTTYIITDTKDEEDVDEDSTNTLRDILSIDSLKNSKDDLMSYSIFVGVHNTDIIISDQDRLAIIDKEDTTSLTRLHSKFIEIYKQCTPMQTISESVLDDLTQIIAGTLYIKGISSYSEHNRITRKLYDLGINTVVVFNKSQTLEEFNCRTLSGIRELYSKQLTDDNYVVINDSFVSNSGVKIFESEYSTFRDVLDLYKYLTSLKEDYVIFNIVSYDINTSLMFAIGMAFLNNAKKPIFRTTYYSNYLLDILNSILYSDNMMPDMKFNRIRALPKVGSMCVYVENNWRNLAYVKKINPKIELKLLSEKVIKGLIQENTLFDREYVTNIYASRCNIVHPIELDVCKFDITTERDINLFELYEGKQRYVLDNIARYVHATFKKFPDTLPVNICTSNDYLEYEDILYSLVRLLEQILCQYSKILTLKDLVVVTDLKTGNKYIGLFNQTVSYVVDTCVIGMANYVTENVEVTEGLLPLNVLYDYRDESFLRLILKAYSKAKIQPPKFKPYVCSYRNSKLTELTLYSAVGKIYSDNSSSFYVLNSDSTILPELIFSDRYVSFMRETWLPEFAKDVTSFGLRNLTRAASPVTVYGDPNIYNMEVNNNSASIRLFWQAFRRIPKRRRF